MFQKEGGAMFSILVAEDDHAITTSYSKMDWENHPEQRKAFTTC